MMEVEKNARVHYFEIEMQSSKRKMVRESKSAPAAKKKRVVERSVVGTDEGK